MKKLIIITVALLFLCGCISNIKPFEAGDNSNPKKVLIAAEESAFKSKVIEGIIGKLGTQEWYFRGVGLDQLAQENTEQYGVILLVSKIAVGRIGGKVRNFLKKNPENPKVVLFLTLGSEAPLPEKTKAGISVDVVTSASVMDKAEMQAARLAELLMNKF